MSFQKYKPILAITLGDPCGIGPEVVLKSLKDPQVYEHCRPLVIGDAQVLSLRHYGVPLKIRPILNPIQARYARGSVDVLHIPCDQFSALPLGRPSRAGGFLSAICVKKSIELALSKLVDGVVHAPISKVAWKMAHFNYPGHTEVLADYCGVEKIGMAIVAEPLRTVLVTRHIPFKDVPKHLTQKAMVSAIELAVGWMHQRGIKKPKIGVCALNPHAGENGLMGREEIQRIQPLIHRLKCQHHWSLVGPLGADSAFRDHLNGKYDVLITLYHDQSLIPLKLFNPNGLVNITLGLPFVRTSPGHGTAFDIAEKRCADPRVMTAAIVTAAKLVGMKRSKS
jgi:4-hydroxythreonine-4-phosphate dehydrogenase